MLTNNFKQYEKLPQKYIPRSTEYQATNSAQGDLECFACSIENLSWALRDEQKFARKQMESIVGTETKAERWVKWYYIFVKYTALSE